MLIESMGQLLGDALIVSRRYLIIFPRDTSIPNSQSRMRETPRTECIARMRVRHI